MRPKAPVRVLSTYALRGMTGRLLPSRLGHVGTWKCSSWGWPATEITLALDAVKDASWTDWRADQR
jgi:hypothetical protein